MAEFRKEKKVAKRLIYSNLDIEDLSKYIFFQYWNLFLKKVERLQTLTYVLSCLMKLEKLLCLKYWGNKSVQKCDTFHTIKLWPSELHETIPSVDGSSTIWYVFVRNSEEAMSLHPFALMWKRNHTILAINPEFDSEFFYERKCKLSISEPWIRSNYVLESIQRLLCKRFRVRSSIRILRFADCSFSTRRQRHHSHKW